MARRLGWALGVVAILASLGTATAGAEETQGRYIVVLKGSVDAPGAVAAKHEAGTARTPTRSTATPSTAT